MLCMNCAFQVLRKELAEVPLLHGSRHGLRPGPSVSVPSLRCGQLAANVCVVERKWLHALGTLRYW